MKYLLSILISSLFFRSFNFFKVLLSKKKTDVLLYYPQHFNTQANTPFILNKIIDTLKNNNFSYILVEEPNPKHKIRNSYAIPNDIFWIIVILLRKCFRGDDYSTIDKKIGRFFSRFIVNHHFSNIITVSQSFQSIFRGMFPNSEIFDYQHGLISKQYFGYVDGERLSKTIISNQCKPLLYGVGVQQKLIKLKFGNYLKENSFVIGSPYESYQKIHNYFNHSVLFSLQFTSSHTEKENHLFLNKTIHFLDYIEQSNLRLKFYVKTHPRHENCIDDSKIYKYNFVERAPESLNECFKLCSLHLTEYSSVVFDALMKGIPTILTEFSDHLNILVDEYRFPKTKSKSLIMLFKKMEDKAFYQSVCDEQIRWSKKIYSPFKVDNFKQVLTNNRD